MTDTAAARFTPPEPNTTRPVLRGSFGMAASTHWLATATAQAVLERGGNAFDAATAAAFVLHVVEPHLNGPGGDLVAIVSNGGADARLGADSDAPSLTDPALRGSGPGGPTVIVGQGPAPAGASIAAYRALGLDLVPGAGALAATVPAAVPAWLALLRERGTWELRDVLAFAIHYARVGHEPVPQLLRTIGTVETLFVEHWPTSRAQWLPDASVPRAGEPLRLERYAETLERLIAAGETATTAAAAATTTTVGAATAEEPTTAAGDRSGDDRRAPLDGRAARIRAAELAWSEGFVAQAVEAFVRQPHRHSDGRDHAGVLTAADLAGHIPFEESTVSIEFRGVTVHKSGPWGQGPVLLQTLRILDALDDDTRLDPSSAIGIHTITEALKLALADRDAYYGDSPEAQDALEVLLSPEYARERAALIGETASLEHRPGTIPGYRPTVPPLLTEAGVSAAGTGEPTVRPTGETRGDTCQLDVIDRWGNAIAATPSGGWLQSSPTIPELGFCLGTRLQMTWLDEGSASALRPGRRPRTTLTPTVLTRDGRTVAALGTPGGDQQDQWQLLYLLRTIVGGYDPQQAIDAPTFHTTALVGSFWPRTWTPGGLVIEDRVGDEVLAELERRGHVVTRAPGWSLGRLSVVGADAPGRVYAAANPRGAQGYAAGR